jgi:hypothetical protein
MRSWQPSDVSSIVGRIDATMPTVIYVHGNRVANGEDKWDGLTMYRRLVNCATSSQPIRFIILSWPSAQIPGPLRDVRVKAARTGPAGCQLAWIVDQMPPDARLGFIGYSYGARIVTGALHINAGGNLSGMGLAAPSTAGRSPARVVLIAAALDADWLAPGHYHGNAMALVDRMLLINNCADPVMKFYHFSNPNGRPRALGLTGPTCIGPDAWKIRCRDVSRYAGSTHDLAAYVCAPGVMQDTWRYVTFEDQGS